MKKKGRALTAVLLGLTMVMSLAGCRSEEGEHSRYGSGGQRGG